MIECGSHDMRVVMNEEETHPPENDIETAREDSIAFVLSAELTTG